MNDGSYRSRGWTGRDALQFVAPSDDNLLQVMLKIAATLLEDSKVLCDAVSHSNIEPSQHLIKRATRATKGGLQLVQLIEAKQEAAGSQRITKFDNLSRDLQRPLGQLVRASTAVIKGTRSIDSKLLEEVDVAAIELSAVVRQVLLAAQVWTRMDRQGAAISSTERSPSIGVGGDTSHTSNTDSSYTSPFAAISILAKHASLAVRDIHMCARGTDEKAFLDAARCMVSRMTQLIACARVHGMFDEEAVLRHATHEVYRVAKDRYMGSVGDSQMDDTINNVVHAIRELLNEAKKQSQTCRPSSAIRMRTSPAPIVPPRSPRVHSSSTSPFSSISSTSTSEGNKQSIMRAHSIRELMDTETVYFTQLKTLTMGFIEPLKKDDTMDLLKGQLGLLLSTITNITSLTKEILNELKGRITKVTEETALVGDVMLQLAPLLKMYTSYINIYDEAADQLQEKRDKSSHVQTFINKFNEFSKVQDVTFLLILPIQRLPRYEMLIGAVLKYTPEGHPDHKNLKDAHSMVKDINMDVNTKKRKAENLRKLNSIKHSIISKEPLSIFEKDRVYMREGMMDEIVKKKRKSYYYFMFNDMMIQTAVKGKAKGKKARGMVYTYTDTINFSQVRVEELPLTSKGIGGEIGFQLVLKDPHNSIETSKKRGRTIYMFLCISEEEKDSWLRDIQDAIAVCTIGM